MALLANTVLPSIKDHAL